MADGITFDDFLLPSSSSRGNKTNTLLAFAGWRQERSESESESESESGANKGDQQAIALRRLAKGEGESRQESFRRDQR